MASSSTELDVARTLCECLPLVEKWEGLGTFKTKDQKRFLALMKQCAEQLLEKDEVRDGYSSELVRATRERWIVRDLNRKTREAIVRGDVLLWLTEAHGLIEDGWHALKVYFDNLWAHVQIFCGHEAVAAAAAAAEEVKQRGEAEPTRDEKLWALMEELKKLVFAFQRELRGEATEGKSP